MAHTSLPSPLILEIQAPLKRCQTVTLVSLLCSTTYIYVEQCDLTSPASICSFCNNYHKSEQRLERSYSLMSIHLLATFSRTRARIWRSNDRPRRARHFCSSRCFSLLLTAPVERDIRLITPSYAAAACVFTASPSSMSSPLRMSYMRGFDGIPGMAELGLKKVGLDCAIGARTHLLDGRIRRTQPGQGVRSLGRRVGKRTCSDCNWPDTNTRRGGNFSHLKTMAVILSQVLMFTGVEERNKKYFVYP